MSTQRIWMALVVSGSIALLGACGGGHTPVVESSSSSSSSSSGVQVPRPAAKVYLSEIDFPDSALRNCVAMEGAKTIVELESLNCSDVQNTAGIEELTSLRKLSFSNCNFDSIDTSKNIELVELAIKDVPLMHIDLSGNTKLTLVYLTNTEITSLNTQYATELITLTVQGNPNLKNLDVTNNTALTHIFFANDALEDLDLSANTSLVGFLSDNSSLKFIDFSSNTALEYVHIKNGQLNDINLAGLIQLVSLDLTNNNVESIDLSSNSYLSAITLRDNNIKTLILPEIEVGNLYIAGNQELCSNITELQSRYPEVNIDCTYPH